MDLQHPTRFDSTYYERYTQRNQKKIEAIVRNIGKSDTLLDIGCNQGYVIRTLLEKKLIQQGSAVELSASVVDPWLITNEHFSLFEGNILDYSFNQVFEAVIFNSVYHYVFGTYGKDIALELWDRIIDHCDRVLIFETGVLTEFGQYYWKDELSKCYSFNEEIINDLLRRVGSRLKSCNPIISLPIHWSRRLVYKIELHPVQSEYNLKPNEINLYGDYYHPDTNWIPIHRYRRTSSSKNQELIGVTDKAANDKRLYSETDFFKLQNIANGKNGFGKNIVNDPYKRLREFFLLKSISHPKISQLLEVHPDYGFVFEYYDWQRFGNLNFRQINHKKRIVDEIRSFYDWASNEHVILNHLDLDPMNRGVSRRLIDIADFHPNNFLIDVENGEIQDWIIVDLEYISNRGASRNYMHLYYLLRRLRPRNAWFFLLYFWYFFRYYLDSHIRIREVALRFFYDLLANIFFSTRLHNRP